MSFILRVASGDSLHVKIEHALRDRLLSGEVGRAVLLGVHEKASPETIRIFAVRSLQGTKYEEWKESYEAYEQSRQSTRAQSRSEVLGYFDSNITRTGAASAESWRFATYLGTQGARLMMSGHSEPDSAWAQMLDPSAQPSWFTWPEAGLPDPSTALPVSEGLAALSTTASLFQTDAILPPPQTRKSPLGPALVVVAFVALIASVGAFLMSSSQAPAAPSITVTELGETTEVSRVEPVAPVSQNGPLEWSADKNNPATAQQPAKPTTPTPAAVNEPPQPARTAKQLDVSSLQRRGPGQSVSQLEEPAPAISSAPGASRVNLPVASTLPSGAPPPPPRPQPQTINVPAARQEPEYVPPKSTKRTSIQLPASMMNAMPPNSSVSIAIRVDERGKVVSAVAQNKTPGVSDFAAAQIAASVRSWQFSPATSGGNPVSATTSVVVNLKK